MQTQVNFVCCVLGAKQKERALKVIARGSLCCRQQLPIFSGTKWEDIIDLRSVFDNILTLNASEKSGYSSIYVGLSERK